MYLKRFTKLERQQHQLRAAPPSQLTRAFSTAASNVAVQGDFYRGTTPDGVETHDMEKFLTQIESLAAPAFRAILDEGKRAADNALPLIWPPLRAKRAALSWWIAAQILRTDRQRQRLRMVREESRDGGLAKPAVNGHLRYIAKMVAPLATLIFGRPWGIGFADACLMTSDTPVLILNGQDEHDQLLAAAFWDIYLPLDPHRALFLPGYMHHERARLRRDHQFKLHPGHAIGLNNAMLQTAVRHVFFHPDHDPRAHLSEPQAGAPPMGVHFALNYAVMKPGFGVERRWLEQHPEPTGGRSKALSKTEVARTAESKIASLDDARRAYEALGNPEDSDPAGS